MAKTPLHHRRRVCRFCRGPIGSLQALATRARKMPAEVLADGEQRVAAGQFETPHAFAFGALEEWTRHLAAEVEGFCNDYCRGASERPAVGAVA